MLRHSPRDVVRGDASLDARRTLSVVLLASLLSTPACRRSVYALEGGEGLVLVEVAAAVAVQELALAVLVVVRVAVVRSATTNITSPLSRLLTVGRVIVVRGMVNCCPPCELVPSAAFTMLCSSYVSDFSLDHQMLYGGVSIFIYSLCPFCTVDHWPSIITPAIKYAAMLRGKRTNFVVGV